MELIQSTTKLWSRRQVYGLAMICLVLGVCAGYSAHAHFQARAVIRRAEMSAGAPASAVTITPSQLKNMADKQAEPLLARLQDSPGNAALLAEIGKAYLHTRQFPMATKYYEDSVRIKPDAVVLVTLGGAYHFAGDEDKAIGSWNLALSLYPNNPDSLYNNGVVKWRAQGDREAAIPAWQKLLKTNPNHPKRAQVEEILAKARVAPRSSDGQE